MSGLSLISSSVLSASQMSKGAGVSSSQNISPVNSNETTSSVDSDSVLTVSPSAARLHDIVA